MLNHIEEIVVDSDGRLSFVWRIPAYRSRGKSSLPVSSPRPTGSMAKNGRSGGRGRVDAHYGPGPWVEPVRWSE